MNFLYDLQPKPPTGDQPLLLVAGKTITWDEQEVRCNVLLSWFERQGIHKGLPVLLAVTDELEQASLLLALIVIGHPPLLLDPQATAEEMASILSQVEYASLIYDETTLECWSLALPDVPNLQVKSLVENRGIFSKMLKRKVETDDGSWPACLSGLQSSVPQKAWSQPADDSLAYVVFSSGTTAQPKGIEISRGALLSQLKALVAQYGLDSACRLLNTLPLFHADGLVQGPLLAWACGGTLLRPMGFSVNRLSSYMDSIYRDRVTHLIAVPTMLALMHRFGMDWRENFDSEDFRFIISTAGLLEMALWQHIEEDFAVPVVNVYGLSETVTSALFSGPDTDTRCLGSLGKPVNCRVKLVDQQGEEVADGETGELWVKGPQLMSGYHGNPQATAEVFTEGWFATGDQLRRGDSGHYEFVGRAGNRINSAGHLISPEEVEACLNQHPAVLESVVIGLDDADWEQRVVALIVTDSASDWGELRQQLTEWCRQRLSEYKLPRQLWQVSGLEKGPAGKVLRNKALQLCQQINSGQSSRISTQGDMSEQVIAVAAQVFRYTPSELSLNSGIGDINGWDSLGHMSLVVALESAFDIRFSAQDIMHIETLRQAVDVCREKQLAG